MIRKCKSEAAVCDVVINPCTPHLLRSDESADSSFCVFRQIRPNNLKSHMKLQGSRKAVPFRKCRQTTHSMLPHLPVPLFALFLPAANSPPQLPPRTIHLSASAAAEAISRFPFDTLHRDFLLRTPLNFLAVSSHYLALRSDRVWSNCIPNERLAQMVQ